MTFVVVLFMVKLSKLDVPVPEIVWSELPLNVTVLTPPEMVPLFMISPVT